MKLLLSLFAFLPLFFSSLAIAETRYVTDEFKVTLRTGTSTSNSILTMLNSGEAVKFIENDSATKYSLVETENGKRGYVLTRFLDTQPSGRELFLQLQRKSKKQKDTFNTLKADFKDLKLQKAEADKQINDLSSQLNEITTTLVTLKDSTKDTIAILETNKNQHAQIIALADEIKFLSAENNAYKDSTAMDWFIRGSGVSLLAFLIGIIVTKIKWKKSNSWGDF